MSTHRRAFQGLFLLLLAVSFASGTAPFLVASSSHAAQAPKATTISFMIWGDPAEKKAYDRLVSEFTARNPDVKVELVYMPSLAAHQQRLAMDFVVGTPSDVFLVNYRRYAQFSAGLFEPLDKYVAKSATMKLDAFYPEAIAPFYWRGKLVGIPQNISSLVVYYNKNLFDAAGIPYPTSEWTWDDFVRTARAFTKDANGDGEIDQFGLGTDAIMFRTLPFIWQNGGELMDDPVAPRRLTLDSPATREALQWFVDLQMKHHVVPNMVQEKAEISASRFLRGTMGMFLDSRRGVPLYRTIKTFDWDVAPLPRGKKPAGILHADGYFMASASRNKAAAWRFIEFANSPPGQTIVAQTGRTVPSLRAVAESPAFLDSAQKPRSSRVFLDVIPHIRAVPVMEIWPDIEAQVSQEIERAYHGNATLDEAILVSIERTTAWFPRSE
jgi:multiple sugar transport system substrate-binding protein